MEVASMGLFPRESKVGWGPGPPTEWGELWKVPLEDIIEGGDKGEYWPLRGRGWVSFDDDLLIDSELLVASECECEEEDEDEDDEGLNCDLLLYWALRIAEA
jgi:hypothetical protein